MTIHRLIQNLAFNPDDLERLAAAYEEALLALHISDRDDPINKIIAQRIIEGARAGVRDPHDSVQDGSQRPYGPITDLTLEAADCGRRSAQSNGPMWVRSSQN